LVVQGDTNTVAAGALAAVKLNIPVAHVEAGLRSYDRSMPEEINRILADRLADMLFAPTGIAADNLITEGTAQDKIHITGNTIVDVIGKNLPLAEKKNVLKRYNINPGEYILVTVHRQENTDDSERLQNIIRGIATAGKLTGTRVIYPAHPRTVKMLQEFKIEIPAQVEIYEPIDYFSFLKLEKEAALIMTDSGGVQEEACILGVSCVTLRENTERPETLEIGANILSGTDADTISEIAVGMITDRNRFWQHPYGDGNSGSRIADIVTEYLG
ncbi:MAG: UDP-N-acetylglucosamine 2-epimerase (non-hydrolyzing), partial [Candidatus Cloacimonetes bacterium]|nr:UDP-N-acetylglucosamine 2-epimerase (non-hydrolyzing) [Candidatus Cloacimonadota bacterium]